LIYIYAVHMTGGSRHEHIASVRWKNPDTGDSGEDTLERMVNWIRTGNGNAYVCGNGHLAKVGVVDGNRRYLRTHADGVWTDNLLALPQY
jgi:hypothetical protein